MKRLVLLILIAGVATAAVWYGLQRAQTTAPSAVTTLLPRNTIFLVHLPDFNRMRNDWHSSDVYQLYREPAVQDFLGKPLSQLPKQNAAADVLREVEQLDVKDGFLGLTSVENNNPRFAAGFRFHGSQTDAAKIVDRWRSRVVRDPTAHETVEYEKHSIDIIGADPNRIASVYDGSWFFLSNDLAELKSILDRADQRAHDPQLILQSDPDFQAAMAHMPSSYAVLFYLQPKQLSEKAAALPGAIGQQLAANQQGTLGQLRSLCGATRFEHGKIHDTLFAGLPAPVGNTALTRSSAQLGTADTFLYFAQLLNFEKLAGADQAASFTAIGGWLQKVYTAASRAGITLDDWKAAFEPEAGSLADWPANAHWPSLIATIPVKDPTKALKIVKAMTTAIDEDAPWKSAQKNGVNYFYMQSPGSLIAMTPTIALSNDKLIAGLDSVSVEAAMGRSASGGQKAGPSLETSATYRVAVRSLPAPTSFFAYIDTSLLYSRLDAALRPMLLMAAAFMPAISEHVDAGKLPPPEVVTRHLSPIVSSQRYERDGYVAESVGPVTLNQALIGVAVPAVLWAVGHGSH